MASKASEDPQVLAAFIAQMAEKASPVVLELGTRRSNPKFSTLHKEWVPHASA
jgi:hypothetical protein